jgi:hypothetical protein
MPIGTLDHVHGLGRAFKRAMHLNFDASTYLFRNNQVSSINPNIALVVAILTQLKGVPLVRLLEARKADARASIPLSLSAMVPKELEGFVKPISNRLQRRSWRVVTCRTSECAVQIIPIRAV